MNYSSVGKSKPKERLQAQEVHQQESKPLHVLRNVFPWKTKEQFVDHYIIKILVITFVSTIVLNVIYFNSDGLIAFNKPFGRLSATNKNWVNNWSQLRACSPYMKH
jgi:hypothetical protein